MVIGIVKTIKIGFTKLFSKPNTTATIIAVSVLSTDTPFKMYDANKTATAVSIAFVKNFIIMQF